ncbi:MAG TPA: glutaredoxin family protein [Bacillales bacterium]|nr:glutaredoxin family protein [Bacillales bacterium]
MYTKVNCPLCEEGRAVLEDLGGEIALDIQEVDIYTDNQLLEKYQLKIPVAEAAGEELDYGRLSKEKIRGQLLRMKESF